MKRSRLLRASASPAVLVSAERRVDHEGAAAVRFEERPDLQEVLLGSAGPRGRRVHLETAGLDVALETDTHRAEVSDDLGRPLVEADEQRGLAAATRGVGERPGEGRPRRARGPRDQDGAAAEVAGIEHRVEIGDTARDALRGDLVVERVRRGTPPPPRPARTAPSGTRCTRPSRPGTSGSAGAGSRRCSRGGAGAGRRSRRGTGGTRNAVSARDPIALVFAVMIPDSPLS